MAFQLTRSLTLGPAKAGLTLYAQLRGPTGSAVGSPVTTGFVELGTGSPTPPGDYLWNYAAFPDAFRGVIEYYDDADDQLLAVEEINPEELTIGGALSLSAAGNEAVADAILNRNVAGGSNAGRLVKQALYFLRNKWVIAGGVLTVYGTDDTTASWTAPVGREVQNQVVSVDPA